MKNALLSLFLLTGSLLALPGNSVAQQSATAQSNQAGIDQEIQLLRSDLRSEKKQVVAANMTLTDAQAEKFWPVYDAYTQETTKLNDTRLALIKEYANNYNNMTDAEASSLTKRALALDESFVKLRQSWLPKFEKVISPKQTAAFFQIDRRIALLIDLQLASEIPLAKQQ